MHTGSTNVIGAQTPCSHFQELPRQLFFDITAFLPNYRSILNLRYSCKTFKQHFPADFPDKYEGLLAYFGRKAPAWLRDMPIFLRQQKQILGYKRLDYDGFFHAILHKVSPLDLNLLNFYMEQEPGRPFACKRTLLHYAAALGSLADCKEVLRRSPRLLFAFDEDGFHACHYAIGAGSEEIYAYLLSEMSLVSAEHARSLSRPVLYNGPPFAPTKNYLRRIIKYFLAAARGGNLAEVRRCLALHVSPNCQWKTRHSIVQPLHAAIEGGHLDIVQTLIDGGLDLRWLATPLRAPCPLEYAARHGQAAILELLLSKLPGPLPAAKLTTLLFKAVQGRGEAVARFLLKQGANPVAKLRSRKQMLSPLALAHKIGSGSLVELLQPV